MKKIYAFIRHNPMTSFGFLLCCFVLFWCYSCQSTVVSLVNPDRKLNRAQLVIEVDSFLAAASDRFNDLDRQDLVKNTIFNSVLDLAQGKAVNPIGVVMALSGILGLGAIGDNIKKRTHINTLKGGNVND